MYALITKRHDNRMPLCKASVKRCMIVDDSARVHFPPALSSTIMKRKKRSSTIMKIFNMFSANDSS